MNVSCVREHHTFPWDQRLYNGVVGFLHLDQFGFKKVTVLKSLMYAAAKIAERNELGESNSEYVEALKKVDDYVSRNPSSINEQWIAEVTPLHDAACRGLPELVKVILSHKPNTSLVNCINETALRRCRWYLKDPEKRDQICNLIEQYDGVGSSSSLSG